MMNGSRSLASSRARFPALALALLACTSARFEAPPRETGTRTQLALNPESADVWATEIAVTLEPHASARAVRCELIGDRARVALSSRGTQFFARIPLSPGSNAFRAGCYDENGRLSVSAPVRYTRRLGEGLEVVDEGGRALTGRPKRASLTEPPPQSAAWLEGAVIYGTIPALYGEQPLAGLRRALPSIAALGVRALWLSPVFDAPAGDFGYAVTDYFSVRPELGTADDISRVIDDAHGLGMRVLLDFVPNHTSNEHPYFEQTLELGTRSHYFDFYVRDRGGRPQHYFDWTNLPNLEFPNPEVRHFMTASALFWINGFQIDGYRVDAAWGIRQRSPSFYDFLLAALRRARADTFVLAEASARDAFYFEHGFDSAYDWTTQVGEWAWKPVFSQPTGIAERLRAALSEGERHTLRRDRVFRFLNNNDTGARFITRHGVGLTRVATVLLLTLPGLPCVYAFDEVGGEFEPYDEGHPPKLSHPELRDFHTQLIRLRAELPALHGDGLRLLSSEPRADVLAYLREPAPGGHPTVLVVLNFAAHPVRTTLELPVDATQRPRRFRRVYEPSKERLDSVRPTLDLPAHGYAVFIAE